MQFPLGRRACGLFALFLLPLPGQAPDLARARQLMGAERFAEAAAIYAEVVKAAPADPGMRMNLGMAQHMAGQDREAIATLERVVAVQPGLFPAQMFLGISYLRTGEPAKAVGPLGKAVALQSEQMDARRMLADALLMVSRHEQAVPHLRRLAAASPNGPKAWYGLGRSYELLAQGSFEKLQQAAPASPYWLALAGESRLRARRFNSAFVLLREAAAAMPGLPGVQAALAEVYEATGHTDWATQTRAKERKAACTAASLPCLFQAGKFEALVTAAKTRRTPEALYWLTRGYNALALGAFHKLTALPPSAEWYELTAEMHRGAGRYAESLAAWREAMKLAPGDARLTQEVATTLYLSGDWAATEASLRAGAHGPEAVFMLGDAVLNQGRAEEAVPLLRKALALRPDYPAAHAALARALGQVGQASEAVPHLEKALALDTDGSLHYQLARAYQAAGRAGDAKRMLAKYQKLAQGAQAETEGTITAPVP